MQSDGGNNAVVRLSELDAETRTVQVIPNIHHTGDANGRRILEGVVHPERRAVPALVIRNVEVTVAVDHLDS